MKFLTILLLTFASFFANALPSICSVVDTQSFDRCLDYKVSETVCGFPQRPCARFTYYVPQHYTEVMGQPGSTFFQAMPGAAGQLASKIDKIPFGAEFDEGTFSFHAHTINIPFTKIAFLGMPCGETLFDLSCFSAMSEDLGQAWKTGSGDRLQPAWLAWSASPKACLLKGAITSATGDRNISKNVPSNCSRPMSWLKLFPPSTLSVCNGWGINFPRYGTVTTTDQTTASLMIASRILSLGEEVFASVPRAMNEKWQMIYPQSSSCFREGQNIGLLRAKRVNESGRLFNARPQDYLYATWKKVTCKRDLPYRVTAKAWIKGLKASCKGVK